VSRVSGGRVTGNGIDCGTNTTTCQSTLDAGTAVSLTATADTGDRVGTWMGCSNNSANPCTLTLNGNASVTPAFVPQYLLTVSRVSGGRVTGNGIDCGTNTTTCQSTLDAGTPVSLTATADTGYRVGTWMGCSSNPTPSSCALTLSGTTTVTQTFVAQYVLTVNQPTGGTITGNGLTCGTQGSTCNATLDTGTAVSLTATADTGYRIGVWSGCSSNPDPNSCALTLSGTTTVTQTFVAQYVLNVTSPAGGTIAGPGDINCGVAGSACSATFDAGASVKVTAHTDNSSSIGAWGDDCNSTTAGSSTCTLTMDGNKTASVTFTYVLTTTAGTGGNVNIGGQSNVCANGCTYAAGTSVSLTAAPTGYWGFWTWSGQCSGMGESCQLTMSGNFSTTALFYIVNQDLADNGVTGDANPTLTLQGTAFSTSNNPRNPASYTCNPGTCPSSWSFDEGSTVNVAIHCLLTGGMFGWSGLGRDVGATESSFRIDHYGTDAQTVTYCTLRARGSCLQFTTTPYPYSAVPANQSLGVAATCPVG
jgi:hypothetical protein